MNLKVSIIIPVYNSRKYIEECLNSVINQTYTNLEIIVINDASTDDSMKIVQKIHDNRIKIIELQKNMGVANARNKGIEVATGEYICFIDADDIWKKDKIEKQIKFIEENNYAFIYSNYIFLRQNKSEKFTNVPKKLTYDEAIKDTTIFSSTVMIDLKKVKKEYIYMQKVGIGEDTLTWWNILKKGIIAYGMEDYLVYYRVHKNSLSANKIKALICAWKNYGRQELGFIKRIWCFSCYIKNAIKRRLSKSKKNN